MSKEHKIGDLMVIKSGGPIMTIVAVSEKSDNRVCCGWFDQTTQYRDNWFNTDALRRKS